MEGLHSSPLAFNESDTEGQTSLLEQRELRRGAGEGPLRASARGSMRTLVRRTLLVLAASIAIGACLATVLCVVLPKLHDRSRTGSMRSVMQGFSERANRPAGSEERPPTDHHQHREHIFTTPMGVQGLHGNHTEYDLKLSSYWDMTNCGPAGDDANSEWCGGSTHHPDCEDEVHVDASLCPSGKAQLIYVKEGTIWNGMTVYLDGCIYAYFAQYGCITTTTTTMTVTTTTTSTSTSSTSTSSTLTVTTSTTSTPTSTSTTSSTSTATTSTTTRECHRGFQLPAAPKRAPDHNGIRLPDVCIDGEGPHTVYVLGDWGGILGEGGPHPAYERPKQLLVKSIDANPQQRVAAQMKNRSSFHAPDYILNVGDSFYWGGLDVHCGIAGNEIAASAQLEWNYEAIYSGPGLDGKPWLGVLGNHDYGGYLFTKGWDQLISYSWKPDGRWRIPAQYWRSTVRYSDFSVDYFFIDTNVFNALFPTDDPGHNVCSAEHNDKDASCGEEGPASVDDCPKWFQKLWADEQQWLESGLAGSYADWQVVVTHFPPTWNQVMWSGLAEKHGIDLFVSGHVHRQEVHYGPGNFMDPTAWIVSGGGGGITSESPPDLVGQDDQYGFMELSLSRDAIRITAVSHGGIERSHTDVRQRHPKAWHPARSPTMPAMPRQAQSKARNSSKVIFKKL